MPLLMPASEFRLDRGH